MSSNLADLLADLLLLVLTSSGEDELNLADLLADLPPVLTSSGEDEFKFGSIYLADLLPAGTDI